mmetsp:Transcript_40476/g.49090  ORF Transcript_40476/g.49090 Transcript_40476/m.49090 type:complete len:106 (-) Transcript_40476:120-437(-)|eukprot:CAMPEP_0197847758 /NCGR_PEP_ID=MMETSP1438-20131217/6993_1 /TAXON_ID=1461541 /ORGANISM="Pterosperma sp., Strain CCMP1384" /LENGTH=105 /DNA_ID=CAMNT_0043459771 /DNA_START=169 /DNA_END=486 /DNA_ORIENTATION=+
MSDPTKESHPRQWAVFSQIDANGDGSLSTQEFHSALEAMGEEGFAYKMIEAMDADGDGEITFVEFVAGFDKLYETVPDSAYAIEDEAERLEEAAKEDIVEDIQRE